MSRFAVGLWIATLFVAGCDNSCQNLCVQIADYAETCGDPFGAAQVATCIDDYASSTSDELATCRVYGSGDVVERQWTCDDVNLYR
jgi:hypothetical protein